MSNICEHVKPVALQRGDDPSLSEMHPITQCLSKANNA